MEEKQGKESEVRRVRKQENVPTQIRLPANMHNYIKQEAARMGIAQNAFIVVLLEQGKKLWEADVTHLQNTK